jgi:hypothetical protein
VQQTRALDAHHSMVYHSANGVVMDVRPCRTSVRDRNGATYSANDDRPGEIIREANSEGGVQLTVQNNGSGRAFAGLQFTTTNTAYSNDDLKMNNNSGTNPNFDPDCRTGSGGRRFF